MKFEPISFLYLPKSYSLCPILVDHYIKTNCLVLVDHFTKSRKYSLIFFPYYSYN